MNFIELAWAAFIYSALGSYDKDYLKLFLNNSFLIELRGNPDDLSIELFNDNIIKFLNQWKCHVSQKIGNEILHFIKINKVILSDFVNKDIRSLSDNDFYTIKCLYDEMTKIKGVKIAIAAKTLHILNPNVFIPTDNYILKKLTTDEKYKIHCIKDYSSLLQYSQNLIAQITNDFNCLDLKDYSYPEDYLTEKLNYPIKKTIGKYIDEYFWITISNKYTIPPNWNPGQL